MRRVLLAALVLLIPTALASWSSSLPATVEPSTVLDWSSGYMFIDPDDSPNPASRRVYFDLLYTPASALGIAPHYEAVLSVWKDCNEDGIMGSSSGETYPSILLLSAAICPPGSRHNDGSTVRELLWIGPGASYPHYHDPDAAVWMDALLPGDPAPCCSPKDVTDSELQFTASVPRWSGTAIFAPEPARATGYARLGSAAIAMYGLSIPGPTGVYGAEICGGATTGVIAGWECDPNNWFLSPRVGETYQLRDIDCTSAC